MTPETRREIDGRLSITQAQTPTGITIQFMNIYQFTASNPTGQTDMWTTFGMGAAYLRDFGKEGRVECCQNREYIWSVSAIFFWALGCGYVDPVVGKHPLEFSFDRIFPSFWNSYILKTDYGGSLFKNLVYFPPYCLYTREVPRSMILLFTLCSLRSNPISRGSRASRFYASCRRSWN